MRILSCGPSKRPATNTNYNRSTSHPSMTNLNESASANSLNRSSNYVTKLGDNNEDNVYAVQNLGLYGNTPVVHDIDPANSHYRNSNGNTMV